MNKIAVICCSAAFFLFAANTHAQKSKAFSGSVKFEIKYEGDFEPQQLAKAPREKEQLISGNFTKTTQNLGGAFMHRLDMVDSVITLIDAPTEKYAISSGALKDKNSEEGKNYVIRKREDTKDICGYTCQGYDIVITVKNEEEEEEEEERQITIVVYTTEAIGIDSNINKHFAAGLKGFPLYQEQPAGEGKKIITQAVEVKKKKLNPIEFSIPANYKYFTQEQWMAYVRQIQGGQQEDDEDF